MVIDPKEGNSSALARRARILFFFLSRGSISMLVWNLRILFLLLHEQYYQDFEMFRVAITGQYEE